jgi:hypothetical protein
VGKNQLSQPAGSEAGNDCTVTTAPDSRLALFVKIHLDSTLSDLQLFKGQFFKGMERISCARRSFCTPFKALKEQPLLLIAVPN